MSFDYEDDLEPNKAHKSRRKPSMQNSSRQDPSAWQPSDIEGRIDFAGGDMDDMDTGENPSSFRDLGSFEFDESGAKFRPRSSAKRENEAGGDSRKRQTGAASESRSRSRRASGESAAARSERGGRDTGKSERARTASSGQGGKPPKNKKRRRIIILIIAEIFALLFIFAYAYVYKIYSMPQRMEFSKEDIKNQELTSEDLKKMKGYWMLAVFGVDSRGSNVGKGTNADVIMICCINQDTGDIKLVSVYRDSYLNVNDKNSYNKINSAYANGGPEQALKALNKNLDLNITDYITFNWKAVADAINILGGIDMEISPAEFKYINGFITETVKSTGVGSNHLKKSGMNHLDGVQAVAYGRLRLMDTDYARTERQRKVIEQAFEKSKTAGYSVLNNILVVVLPQVMHNLDFVDLTNMALNISKYKLGETTGFPMARGEANMGSKGACVVPATLESNVILLHQFLFGDEVYTPTDSVKQFSAKIASDTGIYKEGQVMGHVGTEGFLPKETKAPPVTEAATTKESEEESSEQESESRPAETDKYGNTVIPNTKPLESSAVSPGIGETDEDGNLVDGPEDTEIGTGPGVTPTRPTNPTSPTKPTNPTKPSSPSTEGTQPGPGDITETTTPVKPGGPMESSGANIPGGPGSGGDNSSSNGPGDVISSAGPGS